MKQMIGHKVWSDTSHVHVDGLKELAKKSGVKEFTPHSLRRFVATNMRHNGAELGDIAIAMRHEDPATTIRCYLRDDPELKKATLKMAGKGLLAG